MISQPASPDELPEDCTRDLTNPLPGTSPSHGHEPSLPNSGNAGDLLADDDVDDFPDDDFAGDELFSQEEIEQAYQRALAAFESAQDEVLDESGLDATDLSPNAGGFDETHHDESAALATVAPSAHSADPAATEYAGDDPPSYDEIPVDLAPWTDDRAADPLDGDAVVPLAETSDSAIDPALEEKAHAEFEAIQATLPDETLAVWQADVVASDAPPIHPANPTPTSGRSPSRPASRPKSEATAPPASEREPNVTPAQVIEAALFVGGNPLTAGKLYALLRGAITVEQVPGLIDELNTLYAAQERPYEIRLGDGGYRLELRPEYDRLRARVFGQGPREVRLSQEVLEVLALVAYRQPITQAEIEALGKAGPGNVLRQLLRRELIQLERDPENPREVRYRTTERFLSVFGLANLADLPQPDDLAAR